MAIHTGRSHLSISAIAWLLLGLIMTQGALAAKIVSPDHIEGTTLVNAEQVIDLASSTPNLFIIDSRIPSDRQHGYIEGSTNLADTETNCDSLATLVPDLKTPTLMYCNGPKCGRSATAAKIALSCGYRTIYWFRGGFEEWLAKGYPVIIE